MSENVNGLTMTNLENSFAGAKEKGSRFIGLVIRTDGFPEDEVIINKNANFDSKLAYYQKTYDENLNHKFAKGISIIGFTYANCFETIQDDLEIR
jgi:hypothetical protein